MGALSAVILVLALASAAAGAFLLSRIIASSAMLAWNRGEFDPQRVRQRLDDFAQQVAQHARATKAWPYVAQLFREQRRVRRAAQMRQEMPEAMRLLSISLDSGASLVHALEYAAINTHGVLSEELRRAVWDLQAGHGFEEAMEGLRRRTGGSEFAYLAVAMEIQHQSGGSLGGVLAAVSESLQQSAALSEDLVTKTSQARLSASVVSVMPLVLLGILSLASPSYLSDFLGSPIGILLFCFALVLEAAGIVLVRRSLGVQTGSTLGG